jgi:hypothetical protein
MQQSAVAIEELCAERVAEQAYGSAGSRPLDVGSHHTRLLEAQGGKVANGLGPK